MNFVAKGNWVGYQTVFYNETTGDYGLNINDVIDYANLEIDLQGLAAYLDFGYSVFGHTPVKGVKFLLPNQSLYFSDGKLLVHESEDTISNQLGKKTHEEDVLHMIHQRVNNWANGFSENILIPTSGGFDSRLMNVMIDDKSRIHAYTYGTSFNQGASRESVYASLLAERLGTKWSRVPLGKFNLYMDDWYSQFGPAVAASGTYHIEFYHKIREQERQAKMGLLSGIIGDAWAGAVKVPEIQSASAYRTLGYTHGMSADSKLAMDVDYTGLAEALFDKQKEDLKSADFRIVTAMRTKMMMLQYLIAVPSHMGFPGYSPFVEEDIALAMLNLPVERKNERAWQRDYFRKHNLLFEEEKHKYTYQNSLNYYALVHETLEPLDVSLLREVIKPEYLDWVNQRILHIGAKERVFQTLMHTPKVKGVLKLLGARNGLLAAYFAYITLKPIETLLKKRNASIS
ncbi:hypothetical protein GQF61_10590 [Sphingobacterium sp. DK4209]|uniref:Asparagine synthetase domain-containing protein n=1 Tax=Sphingobacterium zhuxiongii TaxID=2662364 RepID=A0A5Q0Q4Y4_9SPHI|nr:MULTISPECIES: hypothetical protein [unclassified Sphingobacterium]MVZ66306.1 hypothetical protein [Sphingobacterium sp. DK4209]QGA25087.1 hypothetical protein GFH32_01560 [Sphingobacterium sp. dk4302]